MVDFDREAGSLEAFGDLFGNHDTAVLAAGAAEADGEIALALLDVVRQEIGEHLGDARKEFLSLRKAADVPGDARMLAGEGFEFRDVIWIREKTNIEDEVGILLDSVAEAEAGDVNADAGFAAGNRELLFDERPEFVDVELRRVDGDGGECADLFELVAFGLNILDDRTALTERMRAARFREATNEGSVVGFEEDQLGGHLSGNFTIKRGEAIKRLPPANINHQRGLADIGGVPGELGKFRKEIEGKIIYGIEAHILEAFEDSSLA